MNAKKLVLAWIAGSAVAIVLSGLFHRVVMGDFFSHHLMNNLGVGMPGPLFPILIYLPMALIMAYMYPKGYEGRAPAAEGFRFGALAGLLAIIPLNVFFVYLLDIPKVVAFVDVPWHAVEEGLVGLTIGLVYGRFK